jgi:hypothetical protein
MSLRQRCRGRAFLLALLLAGGALAGCERRETNFSQFPGWAEHFARNPPSRDPPSAEDRALLARHAPRFMLPDGHAGLIGFYEDFIARGRLVAPDGREVARGPTPAQLNAVRDDPRIEFVHEPGDAAPTPVVLARIQRAAGPDGEARPWTFLTYNAVFRVSGLPAAMPWWESAALAAIGDLEDWHQLDHYTAATIVLDAAGMPVALAMQQHNGRRTYLIGRDVILPPDGRPVVDVAIRSNELYAHLPGRNVRRAARMQNAESMPYLVTGRGQPILSADDVTEPAREASYRLGFVPPDDAFYVFRGFLGERRRLPGRSGPPGADYNILPGAKGPLTETLAGYWREDDHETLAAIADAARAGDFPMRFAELRRAAFLRDLGCVRRGAPRC